MSTTSNRNRNLLFIIAILLLTNIGMLIYFLGEKKPQPKLKDRKGGLTEMLQKEVGFNEQQVARYKELKELQWDAIRPMFDEMRIAKDSLFRLMANTSVSDSVVNQLADGIAKRQRALDLQTFNHFREVRKICSSPEQMEKYDSAVLRMFRKMGKSKRGETHKEEKK